MVALFRITLVWLLFVLIAAQPPGSPFGRSSSSKSYFADNGYGKIGQPLISPNGEHYNNVTYIAYQGPHEGAYIAAYNHTSESWKGPFKVLDNDLGSYPELPPKKADNHGAPTIAISNDGYINVVIAAHGGCSTQLNRNLHGVGCHKRPNGQSAIMRHARSLYPENIEAWYQVESSGLSSFASYASSIKTHNGDIYIIYRHGTHTADWVYQKSTNGGLTFESPVTILKYELVERIPGEKRVSISWYTTCFTSNQNTKNKNHTIGCQFTHHYHETGPVSNHGPFRYNVYYIEIDTNTGELANATGYKMESPITKENADIHAMAFDSAGGNVMQLDGIFNKNGEPCLLFAKINITGKKVDDLRQIYFLSYNATHGAWNSPVHVLDTINGTADADMYSIGFINDGADFSTPSIIKGNATSISYLLRHQDGTSWDDHPIFFTDSTLQRSYMNVAHVRNEHDDARVLVQIGDPVFSVDNYYSHMFLFGDNGFVPRAQGEATDSWVQCFNATNHEDCFCGKKVLCKDGYEYSQYPPPGMDIFSDVDCNWILGPGGGTNSIDGDCNDFGRRYCPVTCGLCYDIFPEEGTALELSTSPPIHSPTNSSMLSSISSFSPTLLTPEPTLSLMPGLALSPSPSPTSRPTRVSISPQPTSSRTPEPTYANPSRNDNSDGGIFQLIVNTVVQSVGGVIGGNQPAKISDGRGGNAGGFRGRHLNGS